MRPQVKKGRLIMDNTIKDQKVAKAIELIDQLVQKEKDKSVEDVEKLHKLESAVESLAADMRSAVYFVNHYISSAMDVDIRNQEEASNLLCSLWMIPKILTQLLDETEKAENIVFGVYEG